MRDVEYTLNIGIIRVPPLEISMRKQPLKQRWGDYIGIIPHASLVYID
jgi:hypothetical protein